MKKINGWERTRNLFDPASTKPFKLSRSRLENFVKCPRCFYLDRRLGIEQPGFPPYTLNSAVDHLLKKEFDLYRTKRQPHPIMQDFKVDAYPFSHPLFDEWRETFKGIQYHHKETNFILFGAVDDLWINTKKEIIVVDYKATSTTGAVTIDTESRQAYKRQMEIYQWLLRKQNLNVSNTGYFLYCNADKAKPLFEGRLEFKMELIAYEGNDNWVENVIREARQCLESDILPAYGQHCEHCQYQQSFKDPSIQ